MTPTSPLAIDLFCGLGGWAEGLLAEGWRVVGFDIEQHDYGTGGYPGQLVLQDVTTLHGSQFRNASLIVASPPCQAYSYRAMPWKRAKALPPPDNTLFDACFRIQREACEAAGRHIPLIVENVRGAVKWVSQPMKWHFGSYYLWGDVPALMPITLQAQASKVGGTELSGANSGTKVCEDDEGRKNPNPGTWFGSYAEQKERGTISPGRLYSSKSNSRKAASAMIAKIPLPLARHIARTFKPQ